MRDSGGIRAPGSVRSAEQPMLGHPVLCHLVLCHLAKCTLGPPCKQLVSDA